MDAILNSFLLVAIAEMGDKTQLLTLMLVCRYPKPWTILFGILIATLLNHALASYVGSYVSGFFSEEILRWGLFFIFVFFGLWILIPDKEEEVSNTNKLGVLLTTIVIFFWAEMGDKTQLATVAMAAQYQNALTVTIGSTLGMLLANGLVLVIGPTFLKKLPMKYIRWAACLLFILFGCYVLLSA